ncbi:MAG: tetratricopeptide repeat protein [Bryobacteraceae bacterium]|jgi:tetratricopeptide (TPR) repeat protein
MSRRLLALLALGAASLAAQTFGNPQTPPDSPPAQLKTEHPQPATSDKEEVPPEEDASLVTTNYSFNPLQSKKDVLVGKEYARKGNYRAAAGRYLEATKWDDSNSEAWLLLGEADERLKNKDAARDAYKKYLELASDAKNSADIRKKLAKLR